jgi:tetratricopeptide (TPR) repeat protein
MRHLPLVSPLLAIGLLAAALPCAALPPEPKAAARVLADQGYELYEAGKYDEAIDAFRRADQLFHAPTLVFAMAKASARAGKLLEARALFQKVIGEKLPAGAPEEFVGAQNSAEGEITALIPRIPTMIIKVSAPPKLHFSVSIDGVRVAPSALEKAIEQNPGQHAVLVMPETGRGVGRNVILREAESERVEVALVNGAALAPTVTASAPPPPPPVEPSKRGYVVPAIVAFSAGALGLGLGAALGATTLSRASDLEAQCPSHKGCAPSLQAGFSTTNTLAALSTAGFVLGGAGVTAGVILIALPVKDEAAPRASLSFGPGSASLRGSF